MAVMVTTNEERDARMNKDQTSQRPTDEHTRLTEVYDYELHRVGRSVQ